MRLCLRGYSGPGIWDCPITRHHQIHPAKLATDLTAELVSVALIWQRRYVLGLVAHLVPPIVASAVLTRRTADLERLRDTRAGRHVRSEMTPPIVALRVIGDVLTVVGAWRHRPAVIAEGALGLSRLDPRTAVPRSALLTPWGSQTPIRSRGRPVVLVDEPAEQVPSADLARVGRDRLSGRGEG